MDFGVFKDMILTNTRVKTARLLDKYMKYKYGKKTDVCVVSVSGEEIVFSTTAINGIEDPKMDGKALCSMIRHKCGQQMLNTFGLSPPGHTMPILLLLPTPALLKQLGPIEFYRFIKAWPGESKVGDAVVIKYILWTEVDNDLSD